MRRAVVNVATGEHYLAGQKRLVDALTWQPEPIPDFYGWDRMPRLWPRHSERPFAFKAFALRQAAEAGVDLLLWCDSCILPIRSLEPLWGRIERDGYWFANNGWDNYTWTADSAYPDLFRNLYPELACAANRTIPHVVATAFGLNLRSEIGAAFLAEYYRLASQTNAFCGPSRNSNCPDMSLPNSDAAPCGPPDVRGHRHDQTVASVLAWRLGMKLTNCPEIFSYPPAHESTILLADGSMKMTLEDYRRV